MAAVAPTYPPTPNIPNVKHVSWALGIADLGDGVEMADFSDKTVQIIGTFGGATILVEGSPDNVTWTGLADPQGTAISKTAAAIEAVLENPRFIRASSSGGTGTAVVVHLIGRK